MTDTAPTTPSRADVAAALSNLSEEERTALLTEVGANPDPSPVAAPSIVMDKQVGDDPLVFTSATGTVAPALTVDGQLYRCRRKPPGQTLVDAIEARDSGNRTAMAKVMVNLLRACLVPDAQVRYFARFDGSDLRPYDPVTGEVIEGAEELDPLGLDDCLVHGARLVEHYAGRPTGGRAPSGA